MEKEGITYSKKDLLVQVLRKLKQEILRHEFVKRFLKLIQNYKSCGKFKGGFKCSKS